MVNRQLRKKRGRAMRTGRCSRGCEWLGLAHGDRGLNSILYPLNNYIDNYLSTII